MHIHVYAFRVTVNKCSAEESEKGNRMNLKCAIGLHDWKGCKCANCGKTRDEAHDWSGCKCSICGKTRDEGHDWAADCEICCRCGTHRSNAHNWAADCERCSRCGSQRGSAHDWHRDCETCAACGKQRTGAHDWSRDCHVCCKCGHRRETAHSFLPGATKCSMCESPRIALEAAAVSDWAAVEKLAVQGATFAAAASERDALFLRCAQDGPLDLLDLLIAKGVGLNSKNEQGETALILAAQHGHSAMVAKLLGLDANKDIVSERSATALTTACRYGRTDVVRALLTAGAALTAPPVTFQTPLTASAYNDNVDIVELLLAAGVDPKVTNAHGESALLLASSRGHLRVVEKLLAVSEIEALSNLGENALHLATCNGHVGVVRALLDAGANPNVCLSRDGDDTALYGAILREMLDVVKELLGAGADPNGRTGIGSTPIHLAAGQASIDIVRLLLPRSDLTALNINKETPLSVAVMCDRREAALLLAEASGDRELATVIARDGLKHAVPMVGGPWVYLKFIRAIGRCDAGSATWLSVANRAAEAGRLKVDILLRLFDESADDDDLTVIGRLLELASRHKSPLIDVRTLMTVVKRARMGVNRNLLRAACVIAEQLHVRGLGNRAFERHTSAESAAACVYSGLRATKPWKEADIYVVCVEAVGREPIVLDYHLYCAKGSPSDRALTVLLEGWMHYNSARAQRFGSFEGYGVEVRDGVICLSAHSEKLFENAFMWLGEGNKFYFSSGAPFFKEGIQEAAGLLGMLEVVF